ncbi:sialidase family protein [Phycisphaerales bacterium AB-hyl4]|uniref:Sialidase family protein n=1 Tax=Natronomicrosphaera hydrolytica TaxID=3242702 RepID=A0ABV4UB53_9BACT
MHTPESENGRLITTVAASSVTWPRNSEGDVVELADGRLLLIYMEFGDTGSDFSTTRIVAVESSDGGCSWARHRVVTETAPGDVNVYSPNLIRASDGGILLIFMRRHSRSPLATTQYIWKSTDEGEHFAPYAEISGDAVYSLCNAVVKRLRTGRLVLPVVTVLQAIEGKPFAGAVLYSDDDGLTWREAEQRIQLPMRGVMEPHVEESSDGRLLMVMRSQLGSLFMSDSADGGVTWSKPQTTGLRSPESCPELARIPGTGDLLMIWNNSPYDPQFASHYGKRSPLTAAVSTDDGRTWSHVHDIEDDPTRAFSNPGCRFTADGRAVINYWTCPYKPEWSMQGMIDLRVAVIDTAWFYEGISAALRGTESAHFQL